MPADPLDKQLVEAVLSRPRRGKAEMEEAKLAGLRPSRATAAAVASDDDDDDDDEDLDLGPEAIADDPDAVVGVRRSRRTARPTRPPSCRSMPRPSSTRPRRSRSRLGRGPRGARRRPDRDRRPGPDVPQGDRQGRPADRRGGGRPGQGHRARRADGRGARGRRIVSLHEWTLHDTERKTRTPKPQHRAAATAPRRTRWSRDAIAGRGAAKDLLVATPDFHLVKAGKDAQSDGTKERLKEAEEAPPRLQRRARRRTFHRRCSTGRTWPSTTATSTRATTSGCGRSTTGRATASRSRRSSAGSRPASDADLLKRMGYDPEVPANTKLRDRKGDVVEHRPRRPRAADLGQPAAGRRRSPRSTSAAACRSWTSSRRATSA